MHTSRYLNVSRDDEEVMAEVKSYYIHALATGKERHPTVYRKSDGRHSQTTSCRRPNSLSRRDVSCALNSDKNFEQATAILKHRLLYTYVVRRRKSADVIQLRQSVG